MHFLVFFILFLFFFLLFRAALCSIWRFPGSGLNQSCSCPPIPQPQQCQIWGASATYTTAHGNARCLIHRPRPGIEPASSWILVGFVNHWATVGTPWMPCFLSELICTWFHRVRLPLSLCVSMLFFGRGYLKKRRKRGRGGGRGGWY